MMVSPPKSDVQAIRFPEAVMIHIRGQRSNIEQIAIFGAFALLWYGGAHMIKWNQIPVFARVCKYRYVAQTDPNPMGTDI